MAPRDADPGGRPGAAEDALPHADAKVRLRVELDRRRRRVAPETARAAAVSVARALLGEDRLRGAGRIALYAATGGELPSRPCFEAFVARGIHCLLPRVRGAGLEWAETSSWEALVPGRFGVLEPEGDAAPGPTPNEVVLLPGLAFDAKGWRLGRGAGYYDRAFPPGEPAPWLIGVGYAFQQLDAVPHAAHDRRVDALVSEQGLRECGEGA